MVAGKRRGQNTHSYVLPLGCPTGGFLYFSPSQEPLTLPLELDSSLCAFTLGDSGYCLDSPVVSLGLPGQLCCCSSFFFLRFIFIFNSVCECIYVRACVHMSVVACGGRRGQRSRELKSQATVSHLL